ncbi:RNA polymerase sigma factor [Agrobacterium leguminum]|uniref:RNA polymerase sigma factor n=1 Tax=Agrobacterium leguminum TaxID=2792015 RepID=UPI003CE495C9
MISCLRGDPAYRSRRFAYSRIRHRLHIIDRRLHRSTHRPSLHRAGNGVDYRKARLLSWDLQELFRLYAKGIVRSLRSRGIDPETASDLAQDAFLKVLASPPPASAASHNPKSYLYTVARNLSIDHYRRERSLRRVDLPQNAFDAIIDPSPSAETIVYDRQRLQLVEQALAELPRRVREAFQLHRMGGLTISEVAQKLGMSTTRTWVLIRDAYEHIEDRLNGL